MADAVLPENVVTAFLATVLIVGYYLMLLRRWKQRGPPLPPGPRGVPLLGNLPFLDPELHSGFARLARVYGPIFFLRLGTKPAVVVTSPFLAREILRDQDVAFANRDVPASMLVMGYGGRDIVWTPYGAEWRMLRKVCVREMLGNATLDAVYGLRRREMRATVAELNSRTGTRVDVGEGAFLMIMNVITGMLWGGTLKPEERSSIGSKFRQVVGEITELMGKPDVSDLFPGLARFDVQKVQRRMKALFLRFDRLFDTIIDQRLRMDKEGADEKTAEGGERGKERLDFLQFMLKLIEEEEHSKTPFTMNHLRALLMVIN